MSIRAVEVRYVVVDRVSCFLLLDGRRNADGGGGARHNLRCRRRGRSSAPVLPEWIASLPSAVRQKQLLMARLHVLESRFPEQVKGPEEGEG